MRPLRRGILALAALVAGVLGFGVTYLLLVRGATPLLVHPILGAVVACGALILLRVGWSVRKLKRHEPTSLSALQAGQVAMAGQAGAILGAILTGYMASQVLTGLLRPDAAAMHAHAIGAGVTCAASIALTSVGLVVERWCMIDDDDDDVPGGTSARPSVA